jgi:hypothetical protein
VDEIGPQHSSAVHRSSRLISAYRNLLRERRPEREYASGELDHACCFVQNIHPIDATAGWRQRICKKCRPGGLT